MPQSRIKSPLLWMIVILLAIVPLLAWLQWRWIGEISDREAQRLRMNVRTASIYAASNFNQHVLALQRAFPMNDMADNVQDYAPTLAELWKAWKQDGDTLLVEGLYIVKSEKAGKNEAAHFATYRFDADREAFQPINTNETPTLFFENTPRIPISRIISGLQALAVPILPTRLQTPPSGIISEEIPGMLKSGAHGLSPPQFGGGMGEMGSGAMMAIMFSGIKPDVLMVRFDTNYLRKTLLPEIMNTHFQKSSYHWAIINRQDRTVLCSSEESLHTEMFAKADFSVPMGFVPPRAPGPMGKALASVFARLPIAIATEQDTNTMDFSSLLPSIRQGNLPLGLDSALAQSLLGVAELRVVAAAGSVEQEVAAFRQRNLLVSGGILLILAVGLVVVLLAVMRSERLAEQQMRFVAGVSHEIRTPIAVLQSAGENLADGIVKTPEQAQRYGMVMKREITRLLEMTEKTLSFAGIQAGKRTLDRQSASIQALMDETLSRNADFLQGEGFTVKTQIERGLPMLPIDTRALNSVLDNLITNAVKYSTGRQEIVMKAQKQGSMLVLSVQDFGRGIALKDQKHVFEPFFRTNDVINAQIHGTGLGLAIVQYLVKQHGGYVSVESELGRGTTFFVKLPLD
ncbi:MAG: HAMP domain-containing histidine kinase [Candidatus Kapabacteria bacterium]|nr:HAMP domain-containing histidine kinase [Candidatus Kapabacteria bacterium]